MAIDQLTARSAYVPPPADYTANVTLDWATDTDESIGPVPSASDFRPTKPQSPLLSPNLAPCSPDNPVTPTKPVRILTAPTSLRNVFIFAKPDRKSTKTTAASITGKTAPHVSDVRSHALHIQPSTNGHPEGLNESPSLLPSLQPAPLSSDSPTPQPDCALPKPTVTHESTCADDDDDAGEYTPHPPLHFSTPAPSLHLRELLCSNQRDHVTASKHRALPEPAVTLSNDDVAPCAHTSTTDAPSDRVPAISVLINTALANPKHSDATPASVHANPDHHTPPTEPATPTAPILLDNCIPTVHVGPFVNTPASAIPARAPCDLWSLRSGVRNPWSNLSHCRSYIHPPRDLSSLRSSTPNPWNSLRHCDRRSHPFHPHQYSDSKPLRHSHSNPLHPKPARLPTNPELHLAQSPIEPVHLFQIIQHPRGISPTKLKITKTIPTAPTKFQKNIFPARCACGNIIPACKPDRESWRSRDRSFRRSFRRFWDRGCGHSHFSGGIQAWGPCFTERGYMDQLCWSGSGFGSGSGSDCR